MMQWHAELIASVPEFSHADQRPFIDKIRKVARCSGW
jgi:hypothetical protein